MLVIIRSIHGGYEFFLPARYKPVDLIGRVNTKLLKELDHMEQ
jgi:hypothetical protein